jgi:diguanylate cyclase (GGDEF)-like protein
MLWDRERMLLDLTETCVGILVTIACALSALLLVVTLPPVVLLQRSLLHSQLKTQARTDPKTGVLNAGAWQGEADLAIDRARRRGEPLAVLIADVDHFKNVNDTHGHLTGDAMLRSLAAEMRQQVREFDLVGRFGGEEFAILLVGTKAEEACRVADRIRRGVGVVRVFTKDAMVGVTISIGVAVLGAHGRELNELLDAAALSARAATGYASTIPPTPPAAFRRMPDARYPACAGEMAYRPKITKTATIRPALHCTGIAGTERARGASSPVTVRTYAGRCSSAPVGRLGTMAGRSPIVKTIARAVDREWRAAAYLDFA